MTDTEALMLHWLARGDDAQRRHAAARVAIGFDGSPQPGPAPAPAPAPPAAFPPCPHRGPLVESGGGCGCGPKHLCRRDTRVVSAADCVACLAAGPAFDPAPPCPAPPPAAAP